MIKLKSLLLESEDRNLNVNSRPEGVSISMPLGDGYSAVASIDNIGDGRWWVSRVLVGPPHGKMPYEHRRKGIGSILIRRAVQEVLKHEPNAQIIVEPGGTYGMKEADQLRFYKKNGFVDIPDSPGALVYGGNQKLKEGEKEHSELSTFKNTFFSAPYDIPESSNIGEWVRFNKWNKNVGLIRLLPFKIMHLQKLHDGSVAYRLENQLETFGLPARFNEIVKISIKNAKILWIKNIEFVVGKYLEFKENW